MVVKTFASSENTDRKMQKQKSSPQDIIPLYACYRTAIF